MRTSRTGRSFGARMARARRTRCGSSRRRHAFTRPAMRRVVRCCCCRRRLTGSSIQYARRASRSNGARRTGCIRGLATICRTTMPNGRATRSPRGKASTKARVTFARQAHDFDTQDTMKTPIVNLDTLDPQPLPPEFAPTGAAAERYAPRIARIGGMVGAKKLGYCLIVLEPGKRAVAFHHHRVNEEMFLVIEGEGEVRIGQEKHAIRAGDV